MAHLVKPWVVRYVDKNGRRVPKGTPKAKRVRERAAKWYGQGIPGLPPGKRIPLAADKDTAKRELAKLVIEAVRGEKGLTDTYARHRVRPLADHLDDFKSLLGTKGKTAKHVKQTYTHCKAVLDGCGFTTFTELDSLKLAQWLAKERAADRIGPKTSNYFLRDFKSFLRWLAGDRRMPKDHQCLDVESVDAGQDVRRARRELMPAELLSVLAAARKSGKRFKGLNGPARYYLYLTACGTGFRVRELASLMPESFALDGRIPTATVAARRSKNRKVSMQPLPMGIVAELREFIDGKPAGVPLWPGSWKNKAAEMLQIDLGTAGVPYSITGPDGTDRYADFHALRHTYITYLADAGVSPKHAQELARHSDIRLTMDRYTHSQAQALSDSVNRLALPCSGQDADPLAKLSRAQLEAICGKLLAVVGVLVARPVALTIDSVGDGSGQEGTGATDTGCAV